ncbi:MAG TPA: ribosome-associated translation inhibitor RaiA [Candidatus Paceibacterota bacterium]|jgi:putative sigma-54 modulation protein|nr:ribosome-associated translation inhibitor RaiA [Candidatus Paceibacterota bacterium]
MNINIKATNMELTGAISDYVNKRLASIEKFAKEHELSGHVEVEKTTNHHKQGDVFKAEFDINLKGENFFTVSEKDDLYAAIDDAKEEISRMIISQKDRKQTLFKRGAASVKKMLKGISKRNPFTSKY